MLVNFQHGSLLFIDPVCWGQMFLSYMMTEMP